MINAALSENCVIASVSAAILRNVQLDRDYELHPCVTLAGRTKCVHILLERSASFLAMTEISIMHSRDLDNYFLCKYLSSKARNLPGLIGLRRNSKPCSPARRDRSSTCAAETIHTGTSPHRLRNSSASCMPLVSGSSW